jgi:uncharacterized tellurite resistance protein B-like protein
MMQLEKRNCFMEQTMQYLQAIMYIAAADNVITPNEYACFYEVAEANGLKKCCADEIKAEIESGNTDLEAILYEISDEDMKKKLLHDLIMMCYADDEYSLAEQMGMRDICTVLSVSPKKLEKMEREAKLAHSMQKTSETVVDAINAGANGVVALGKRTIDDGNSLVHSVASGMNVVGAKISFSLKSAKKTKEENYELRTQLEKATLTEAVKQKVVIQLNSKISSLREQLLVEKKRNQQNEKMILELQVQIDDLIETMKVAQNTRTL